ncbi:WhiB family transcriptional regulator [Streptomyces lasiicapitis]|uniref:WhiB family transcriptional regulator n=1 Tax=Streptomyces lasiicapitis TaxID=1923961 RepID=UPI003332F002
MFNVNQTTALSELEAHPNWGSRACAVTDELGGLLVDPDVFYRPGDEQTAKRICRGCPLLAACRAYAMGGSGWWETDGVWGGLTADERRAERRAEKKRRTRLARQGDRRPQPVASWAPTPAQASLLQALSAQPDLRAAAEAMTMPFPNVRWVYSQMCRQLGFQQDELSVPEVLEEVTARLLTPDLGVAA